MKFLFAALAIAGIATVEAGSYQCGAHEEYASGKCLCKLGYIRHQGVCKRCPENSKYSCKRNICVCAKGYIYDTPSHECVHEDDSSSYGSSHDSSSYGSSHDSSSGSGSYHGHGHYRCGPNEISIPGGGCDCDYKNGYARLDGINCLKCPKNGHWEAKWNRCECNYDFKFSNGECVPDCKANEVFTPGGGCTCKPKFNKYDGVNCTRCPARSWYNVDTDDCVCEWGFVMQNYKCVPKSH